MIRRRKEAVAAAASKSRAARAKKKKQQKQESASVVPVLRTPLRSLVRWTILHPSRKISSSSGIGYLRCSSSRRMGGSYGECIRRVARDGGRTRSGGVTGVLTVEDGGENF
jgi:hypothetical protein